MEHAKGDMDIINVNNAPGFVLGALPSNATPNFGILRGIVIPESHQHIRNSQLHDQGLFDDDSNSITYGPDESESSKVEYILLSMFGSIVGIFLICQIVIHCRACSAKHNACQVGKRAWWSIRKKGKTPRSFQCGLDKDSTVWAHHYEPYPMVPCRRGLVYSSRNAPCSSTSSNGMFSDSYKSSSESDSTLASPSNMMETVGSRSCQSCGSSSTVFLLNPNQCCNHHYLTRTDTVVQVHSPFPMDDRTTVFHHTNSSASESSRSSSSLSESSDHVRPQLSVSSDMQHVQLPIYHALRASTLNCENPGYDTDADSNPKLTDREAISSDKSTSIASDKSVLPICSESSSAGESLPEHSDTSSSSGCSGNRSTRARRALPLKTGSSQTTDAEKTSQKSDESLTTVSSMSGPSSHYQSTKTLSTMSTLSG